ncbi:MAG: MC/SLC25 family protein [Legionellaceae bacterium]|nr:MC/SLC25 family protein [Legionellaceae bacterium]
MNEKKLSTIENYAIGALSGLAEVLVTNPFFVVKTKMQQNKSWLLTPTAYYKGSTANALGFMPITAIQVGANKWIQSRIFNNHPTYMQQVGSAFTAGVLSSFVSCPVERIMILQNDHPKTSVSNLLSWQLKTKGLSGFFVGQLATSLREGGFSVFFLAVLPVIKSKLKSDGLDDASSSVLAGVSSGIALTLITQPVDTIKTTQQSAVDSNLGFFKIAKNMTTPTLFKGIVARSSSLVLSITLMDWVKGQLEDLCEEHGESIYHRMGLKK